MANGSLSRFSPRLVSDRPVVRTAVPTTVPMQPDWQKICQDLTSFGPVEITTANPAAALSCLAEPWQAHFVDDLIVVDGPGAGLVTQPARLGSATIENGPGFGAADHVLRWRDWAGEEVLRVSLTDESNWPGFHSMLVRQWAQRGLPRPVIGGTQAEPPGSFQRLSHRIQGWDADQLHAAWYPAGWSVPGSQMPPRRPVDPTLVSPFLEAMAEQGCSLRLLVGNTALLHSHETDFYDCRGGAGLCLRGSTASLSLAVDRVCYAWVVEGRQGAADARDYLRLADAQGRTVLTLAPGSRGNGGESDAWLWRTLVAALID